MSSPTADVSVRVAWAETPVKGTMHANAAAAKTDKFLVMFMAIPPGDIMRRDAESAQALNPRLRKLRQVQHTDFLSS